MKKVILILLFAIPSLPCNSNASEHRNANNKQHFKKTNWTMIGKVGWAAAAGISLAAIIPAMRSDLRAKTGNCSR